MRELRREFHQQLGEVDQKILELLKLVPQDLKLATDGLLQERPEVQKVVYERERTIDALYSELEEFANQQLALQGPVADDLRLIVSVLRVVPEIERSHDLIVEIAERAAHGISDAISKRAKTLVVEMCATACEMWDIVTESWEGRDPSAPRALADRDSAMDNLHATLMAELASGTMPLAVTMDMTLVGRFYERLGAHAVNVARRIVFLAGEE